MSTGPGFLSYSALLRHLAATRPQQPAVIAVARDGGEATLTWRELEQAANRAARLLDARGVDRSSLVVVAVPNSIAHVVAASAVWKLGGCVLPLNPVAPAAERDQHLALAKPAAVVADWTDVDALPPSELLNSPQTADPLPDAVPNPGKAIGTGGSTGRPKLIVSTGPWGYHPQFEDILAGFGLLRDLVQLLPGPLHHNFGFDWCYHGILNGHTIVLMERFDADLAVDLIERHRIEYAGLVPTMMRRIAELPDIKQRDLSSLRTILHSAGPCPPWVKEAWIDLIGAPGVIEGYGASEGFGNTIIHGDEWLQHRGSVGRPFQCELKILDDDGAEVPAGTVGEVWMRRPNVGDRYIGEQRARVRPDGFGSVGDLGWVDEDSYLYLADRRTDLIVSGGVNVYPAEVEGALASHHAVADVAVIGLPDDEWGHVVHAIVQLRPSSEPHSQEDLRAHCRQLLAPYKTPKSFEFVDALPRDDGGKLRRNALRTQRLATTG